MKRLVLTHRLPVFDAPEVRERATDEILRVFDGEVIWGEDLLELEVGAPTRRPSPLR